MTDRMRTLPFEDLLEWILKELETKRSIFGVPKELFFVPRDDAPYTSTLFGHRLAAPIGPAAGPHTQLTQNILTAWLCGGRFIELKTVQIMDDLDIPRPCIDMEDEGYNVEWSQELRLHESLDEYVKAWVLIHVLRRVLRFEHTTFGTIFNMSVGYNLEGILSTPMQRFMDQLQDATGALERLGEVLRERYPRFGDIEIPSRVIDSVTLSTMHGCPSNEIEKIARYLIEERGLHTTVKLNPTLLGKDAVLHILHEKLGYRSIDIPDAVFEHDLSYDRALDLIRSLQAAAGDRGLTFGVKLSNTLAMANHKDVLPGDEMYMSGRALYPVTINLFHRLAEDLDGNLNVSYSAGADALNLPDLLSAGALPVTVASDLLKPGGYARLAQYLERIEAALGERGASELSTFASGRRERLAEIARTALDDPRYKKAYHPHGLPKVESKLQAFDCIEAPCVAHCAVCQDVPEYAHWLADGADDSALATILHRNPLPGVTGYVCTHLCQTGCTRNVYDEPVAIRRLKRFAVERGNVNLPTAPRVDRSVAVVGSGPSGLAAAFFLAASGIRVAIFEAKDRPGGMLAIAPSFRLPEEIVRADIARIEGLGVEIECNHPIDTSPEELLAEGLNGVEGGFDAVYLACGFSEDAGLAIDGSEAQGVFGALAFLDRVAHGDAPELGERVVVVGGGNTAMDAARTAQRLTGQPATVVYRRGRSEMPAEVDEIHDLLAEGNELLELVSPVRVRAKDGRAAGLICARNELGEPDEDGRRRPVRIDGSEFELPASAILFATGQKPATEFLAGSGVVVLDDGRIHIDEATGRTENGRVYGGGDITRGPAIIIEACADGRRAAEAICEQLGIALAAPLPPERGVSEEEIRRLKVARSRKAAQRLPTFLPVEERAGFDLVEGTLAEDEARAEAARCLQCQILCDRCVEVCPNRANLAIRVPIIDVRLPILTAEGSELKANGEEHVTISQERQILHIDDLCNECGNCSTFCTHDGGRPYADKPRLFLRRDDFEAESDNAWYVEKDAISRREGGCKARLGRTSSGFVYESEAVRVRLTPDCVVEATELKAPFDGPISLRPAVEMAVLLVGITETASYVPITTEPSRGGA
jgi:putative selenate reductase